MSNINTNSNYHARTGKQLHNQIRLERFLITCILSTAAFISILTLQGCGGSDISQEDMQDADGLVCFGDPLYDGPCKLEDRKPAVYTQE